jgi:hypothetical protein
MVLAFDLLTVDHSVWWLSSPLRGSEPIKHVCVYGVIDRRLLVFLECCGLYLNH